MEPLEMLSDPKNALEIAVLVVNVFMYYTNTKIRSDISELKIWVLENFERRENTTAKAA